MKKSFLRLTADTMQKLAIGSILVGLFQGKGVGLWLGLGFLAASYLLTAWEVKAWISGSDSRSWASSSLPWASG